MKYRIHLIYILIVAAVLFQACEIKDKSKYSPTQEEIKKKVDAYVDAFNRHSPENISSHWSKDAYFINISTEESTIGREEITKYFKNQFESVPNAQSLKVTLSTIYFPSTKEAIAKGIADITYSDKSTKKMAFVAQFIIEDEQWVIKNFYVNELLASISHFTQLKELDWLAGNWVDDDENIDVTYTFEWDKNKNFLTEHFVSSILGYEQLSGMQIIGWDPIESKIHSWTFDSDGGFGQSVWFREGNTWFASLTFTMPHGGKATSIHVLKKIDENTFTFASENREINGKLLPNIGPFKVIRKK